MRRAHFLASASASASLLLACPAWATAGLDIDGPEDGPPDGPPDAGGMPAIAGLPVRVRVGADDAARYRGTLADMGSARVNTLSLEEYLLGVVPEEMPSAWPQAALEAQAIVARTYALRKRNPAKPYDLVAGTADQMYGGMNAESPQATDAVSSTSSLIVTYNGAVADVAYMACCGGHTENSQLLWGSDVPYLHGVPDPYCAAAPDSTWTVALNWDVLSRSLHLESDGSMQNVQLIGNPGARPTVLRFISDGTSQDIAISDLRRAYSGSLPSTYIRNAALQHVGDDGGTTLVLTGAGRGHGVGLCQWGARGMAQAGANAAQIIAYYFPTTSLGRTSSIT